MGLLRRFVILRGPVLAVAMTAALVVSGMSGCGGSLPERDLILVSVDTLRADRMSLYGADRPTDLSADAPWSPRWLAARGTTWEWCWAPAGKTTPSLASFWTGIEPLEHGATDHGLDFLFPSLAERFKKEGFTTLARVANKTLIAPIFGKGFDDYAIRAKVDEPQVHGDLLRLAEKPISAGRPLLLWAHYMAPHQSYEPPQANRLWADPNGLPATKSVLQAMNVDPSQATPQAVEQIRGLYDGEVLTASQYVQQLLAGLDQHYRDAGRGGLLKNATVVFFSDHGEELADHHGYFMHAKSLYTGVIRVPLIIAGEGYEAGARIEEPIALLEVMPMVMGREREQQDFFFASWKRDFYVVRDARWTLVHNPCNQYPNGPLEPPENGLFRYPKVGLYDRNADPTEQRNLARVHPEVTRRLLGALRDWYDSLALAPAAKMRPGLTPKELQELGYVAAKGKTICEPWTPGRWQSK